MKPTMPSNIARACLRTLTPPPSGLRLLHVIGSSPGYEAFQVAETEEALGFKLESRSAPACG